MDIKSYFGRKQEALIGLDISSWGIKVVALSGSMDSPAVETMDSVCLPPGCVVEGNIVKMAEVAQVLQSLLQKNKIKAKTNCTDAPIKALHFTCTPLRINRITTAVSKGRSINKVKFM